MQQCGKAQALSAVLSPLHFCAMGLCGLASEANVGTDTG